MDYIFQFVPGDIVFELEVDAAFTGLDFGELGMELRNAGDALCIDRGTVFTIAQAHPAFALLKHYYPKGDFVLCPGIQLQD